ncbi:MAG: hypoxanthine phosphoribosyltransferase [Candidatus Marinimicrobia bacterium]|nr:hypoxanthine phosphoribosyltransferase [Candidatus Neomarinimicrobiota bacterium]
MIKKTLTLDYGGSFDGQVLDMLISEEEIQERVKQIARQISKDYRDKEKPPIMIGVLNGSFYFMADLLRAMTIEAEMDFIKILPDQKKGGFDRYRPADQGYQRRHTQPRHYPCGGYYRYRPVDQVILRRHFENSHPASVRVVVLLYKKEITDVEVEPEYIGFEIPDKFIVGYGLDIEQQYRRLRDIFAMDMPKRQ